MNQFISKLIDFAQVSDGLSEGSGAPDMSAAFSDKLNDPRAVNRESTARVEGLELDTDEAVAELKRSMLADGGNLSTEVSSNLSEEEDDPEYREAKAYLARPDVAADMERIAAEGKERDAKRATEKSYTENVANQVRLELAAIGFARDPATGADLEAFEDSERAANWLAIPPAVREQYIASGQIDAETVMELSGLALDYLEEQKNTRIIDSEASRIEGVTDALSALAGELKIPDSDVPEWVTLILARASEYAGSDVSEMAPADADAAFRAAVEVERGMQKAQMTADFKRSIMEDGGIVSLSEGLEIGGKKVVEDYAPTVKMGDAYDRITRAMSGRRGRGLTSAEVRQQVGGRSEVERGHEAIQSIAYAMAAKAKQRGR